MESKRPPYGSAPIQRKAQQEKAPSLGSFAKNMLIGGAIYMASSTALNIAGRGLIKYMAPQISKIAGSGFNLGKIASSMAKNSGGGIGASIAEKLGFTLTYEGQKVVAPSLGGLVTRGIHTRATSGKFGRGIADFLKVSKQTQTKNAGFSQFMKQTARYYKPKNVSSSALSRFVGGMAVKAGQVAGDLPMMYAIDRSFGNLYGLDQTHKPPISDVGATFKDFAKWSGTVGPGFMMFRSLGPLAKAAKYQTAKTLARPTIRDAFIRPGFQALSRVYRKGQAATHGFSTLINQMNQEFEEQLFKAPTKRKDLFNPIHHLKTFGVFAKKQAQKFKDLRQTDESKAGTVRRLYRTHMERWDRQIQEKSYASTADSYLNMYADVNGSQITKKSKVAVKMRKALDREVKLRNRKSSSMLGYVLGEVDDQGIHRFETAKVDPLERLRHLASSTAINDTQRTKYQKLYNAFDRRTGVFKERAARRTFQNQIELRNFTKVDNSLVNLNKGALGGLGKMLENIELPNPVRALSNVIGRPVGEVSFKPFHMLSAGALNKRNPVYSFRGYKGGKLPSINAAGLFAEKEIEKYGALVGGRPLQAIGNKLVYEPFAQRFRNINGQIYEKALRGVRAAMAEEQYDAKKNIHRQKVKMMSGASLAQTAEAVKEGDLGVLDLLRHDLPRHVRQTTEKVKYAFELGEYGSGHRSAPTSIVSRFKKFFNPRGYNAFERYGEAGRLMNTIANSSADDVERMLNNKIEAGAFVQNMLKIQSKAGRLINNAQDEMLFMVKASELEKGLHHKKFQNNDVVNIIRQRRGKSTNDFYDFLLNNVDDAIEHTNSTKQQNVLKTAKELAQSLRDGGNTSNIKLNWFGKSFDETDFLRRSALLTDHLKNIATKETNDVTSDIFQQMINSRSSNITSAYAFAQKIGGENPFKMRMDFSRMEQKYRDLKKVGVFVQNRGDKPDVARQFEQSFRKLFSPQQRGADGGDEFLGYFRRYGDSLSTANRSKGALKSLFKSEERFTEYDSVMQQINRQFFNPRQESFLLESIDYGKLSAEAQRNASKYQMKNVYGHYLMNRMNEVASVSGMAIDTRNKTTPGSIMQTWALKRAAPLMGLAIGWEIADQVTDIADVGPFDEGLNVFAAEKAIQFQDMTSRMRDAIGITSAAQKMEGIAPGFVTSPGASLLRTSGLAFGSALVGTIMGNPAAGAAIGLTAAGFQDFGLADLTKSHEENRDIWSGRKKVPIRSGARWSLSKAFYGGDRIKGWAPHWFTRMKTQAEYSPTLYGSKLEALIYKPWSMLGINPIGSLIDPYHYEKVHYDRRPYLYTSPAADEMPIVGAAMGATVGQLIKPTRTMHSQDVAAKRGAAVPAEFTKRNSELQAYARASLMAERTGKSYEDAPNVGTGVNLATPNGIQMTADRLIKEGFQQPMGLYGWAGKLASDKVFDKDTPFSPEEHIAGSGEMTSFRRQYWDQQLGDLLLVNEFVRRMIPERDAGYNPLANTMQFLPNEEEYYINFREGDPYCVSADTLIETGNLQFTAADSITKKSVITTHLNNKIPVNNIAIRNINKGESVYSLKIESLPAIEYKFSEEHPLLIVDRNKLYKLSKTYELEKELVSYLYDNYKSLPEICDHFNLSYTYTSTILSHLQKIGHVLKNQNEFTSTVEMCPDLGVDDFVFKQMQNLEINDYAVYPTPIIKQEKQYIILSEILNGYSASDKYIYLRSSPETIKCLEYFEHRNKYKFGNRTKSILRELNITRRQFEITQAIYRHNTIERIPTKIKMTPDIMWLFGLYLAEGWLGDTYIAFAGHINEEQYRIEKIKNALRDLRYSKDITISAYRMSENGSSIIVQNKFLANIFDHLFGKNDAHSKHIPEALAQYGSELLSHLVDGYMHGDGCHFIDKPTSKKINTYSIKSVNKTLLLQIRKILQSFGITSSIIKNAARNSRYNSKSIRSGTSYTLKITGKNAIKYENIRQIDNIPEYLFYKIKQINKIHDIDIVYGFEIEQDDTFCVASFATHNTKVPLGEYRLPGEGYEATNKVDITFPLGASAAGKDPADMMQVMAGIKSDDEELLETAEAGTKIHKLIQEAQMSQGLIKEAEKFVYDPMTNMHGYVDMIGQYGEVIEIKTVGSAEELDQLDQPKYHHTAQVNVYMKATDTKNAKIIYAARDDPSQMREFNVGFSHNVYNKTLENVARARNVASQIDRKLMSPGAGYSHLDRFKILADVAPLSKKYQSEKSVLETKAELGELTSEQYYEYYEAQKMAEAQMRPSDMFPNRFMDNLGGHRSTYGITAENIRAKAKADALMRGEGGQLDYDVISKGLDAEYNQYNINSNIKDAAEYNFAERALGAAWELGMKVQIPYVSRKFFQYWTPMESYKRNVLQGSKDSYWNTPIQSFVEPEMQMMAATTSPVQGAVTGGFIGSFAGPIGGVLGMAAGSLYGTGRGMLEQANIIDPFVKEDVFKARTAERYIDDMKMISAQAEYQQTGNVAAQKMYNTTLMGSMAIGKPEYGYLKGLARKERAYVSSIVESGNEEMQQEIERYLPDTNRKAAQGVMSETGQSRYYDMQREEPTYDGPALDWNVVNDDHLMDKMKYQFIDDMGGNAYLSGLGWKNQMVGFKVSKGLSDMRNPALKNNQTLAFGEAALKDVIYGAIREVQSTAIVSVFPDSVDDIIIEVT